MKGHNQRAAMLLASLLCVGMLGTGAVAALAEEGGESAGGGVDLSVSYTIGDLPYHTWYSNFGYYDGGYIKYVMKAGMFNASAENYGLTPFDTKESDNKISLSTAAGLAIENWRWMFAANSSVVIEMQSQITGAIAFDYSTVTLGGWMEAYNTVFSVHRLNAADKTLDTLVNYFHGADTVGGATISTGVSNDLYTISIDVKAGDVVYYEVGAIAAGRNLQNMTSAKIIASPTEVSPVVVNTYSAMLDKQVAALTQENYAESDWTLIQGYVTTFKNGTYETPEALYTAYTTAKSSIEGVTPDPLKDKRTNLLNQLKTFYNSLVEDNYTAENWTIVKNAYDAFVAGAGECETEEELQALYDEKYAAMDEVGMYKQTINYLDYPKTMNENGYNWIEGDVVDTKLYAGSVEGGLKEYDTQGDTVHKMYNAELNADLGGSYAYYAENWKWYIGLDAGVIVAYRAKVDCKITVTDTRIADGGSSNGWAADCVLNTYIVRDGVAKKVNTINAPSSDEDFSGVYYAKAGDIIYIELISFTITAGSVRNSEAPCNTKALADSTGFDEEAYAEQNHDLPAEVTAAIEEKKQALESYYAGLTESDYSASNWLTLADYIDQFVSKCETEVSTVEEVEALYNEILGEMQAIPTLAQAAEELRATLEGYIAELQAAYDELVAQNKYTDENKAALDKALEDGKEAIGAASSKAAGNTAKLNAIAALKAIEAKPADSAGGCGSVAGGLSVLMGAALVGAVVLNKKKED